MLGLLSLRLPRLIAANSKAGMENAIAHGLPASHLHFLPNVVDTDRFQAGTKISGPLRLLCVGRLTAQKRIDRFLAIMAGLRQRVNMPLKGIIVGTGALRSQLEQQTLALGLSDIIEFRGAVADMVSAYREADMLVLTSDWEGTPNVVLEAMASGLPVVATKVGGVREIVQPEITGYIVEPEDKDTMLKVSTEAAGEKTAITTGVPT